MELSDALTKVSLEVKDARSKYAPCKSYHEGYAIIKEEFDELWDEIKNKRRDEHAIFIEAKHVAATAVRLMCEAEELKGK